MKLLKSSKRAQQGTAMAAAIALGMTLAACGGDNGASNEAGSAADANAQCTEGAAKNVTIAYQPGLGYANLRLIKFDKTLEKEVPGVTFQWKELNSGAAIRDGVVAGEIQISAGGVGPFIIGRGAGVEWKTIAALNAMNLQLMAKDAKYKTLKDLQGAGKIAMPGPDSIQSIVLRKGAEEQLGDAKALDSQIIAMPHPDGVQALISGQIAAHLTSPPFQTQEADQGAHVVLNSFEVFGGPHTFNGLYTTEKFAACNPDLMAGLIRTLGDANTMIKDDTKTAAEKLSQEIKGLKADVIESQLKAEGTEFTTTPKAFGKFADFMQKIGLIKTKLTTQDMFFDNDATKGGD